MLEIGEEVVIRPDIDLESGLGIVRQMVRYAGQTVTIRSNQYRAGMHSKGRFCEVPL